MAASLAGCFHSEPADTQKAYCDEMLEEIEVTTKLRDASSGAQQAGLQRELDRLVRTYQLDEC
ncbi:MAG: hypothetical protein EBT80_09345 [Chitinophagales bacterium]|nr:hypothetical protein [Chitinophagales bacterium]